MTAAPACAGGRGARGALLAAGVALFALTWDLPVDYVSSDARGTLLTAQAILEHGTTRLDAYPQQVAALGYRVTRRDGHAHYGFPVGTPLLAVPAVAAARLAGLDMADEAHDRLVQMILAGALLVAAFLLVHALARLHLGPWPSLAVAAAFGFGTTLTSLLGSALWNQSAAIVLSLAALWLLERERAGGRAANPALLGALVFLAALCRPTAALLALVVGAELAAGDRWAGTRRRRTLGAFALAIAVPAALFAAWSWREFGQLLPDYYLPQRVARSATVTTALWGNLASPGRGFFVYNPLLLLTALGVAVHRRRLRGALPWLCAAWIVVHWLVVSRFDHWWGGHSFGNRLLADTLPAWALLSVAVAREELRRGRRRASLAAAVVLAGWGVFLHAAQGLHNPHTATWNRVPRIDDHPELILDWRWPQFLATLETLAARQVAVAPAAPDDGAATLANDLVGSEGFHGEEAAEDGVFRWTSGARARLLLRAGPSAGPLTLTLRTAFFGEQTATVRVNGRDVGVLAGRWFPPVETALAVPAAAAAVGAARGYHEVELVLPDAARPADVVPGSHDRRVLAVALHDVRLTTLAARGGGAAARPAGAARGGP